jgi:hypothetical protein
VTAGDVVGPGSPQDLVHLSAARTHQAGDGLSAVGAGKQLRQSVPQPLAQALAQGGGVAAGQAGVRVLERVQGGGGNAQAMA